MQRVFMVGWDGATFDLIKPWVAEGKLPVIARLLERGVHGPLRSTTPPWTFPAWTSFMTGKNPGKHGIYDFFRPREASYDLEFVNGSHRRAPTFWRLLSDAGRKVVSISLPCTFPPEEVNGVMISGFDFPGEGPGSNVDARGMHPPSLYDELKRNVGYHPIDASIMREINRGEFDVVLDRILETIRRKARTAEYLMNKEWDCFMILFGESDGSGHQLWKFTDPKSPLFTEQPAGLRDSILRVYQELDRVLGNFLQQLPDDTVVMMMSDHGFGGVSDWVLYPNCWLREIGALNVRPQRAQHSNHWLDTLKMWGVESLPAFVQRLVYRHASRLVGHVEAKVRYGGIDWQRTEAYFDETPYFPMLRINLCGRQPKGIVAPTDYDSVRDRLIQRLEDWRHPVTGERIVEKAYRREELYSGHCIEQAPDIIPKWALIDGYSYAFRKSGNSASQYWIEQVDPESDEYRAFFVGKSGTHRDDGIFLVQGPGIRARHEISNAKIIDLAPTLLALLEVPIPDDMDGRVLREAFQTDFQIDYQHVEVESKDEIQELCYSHEDHQRVNDRLRELGYVE